MSENHAKCPQYNEIIMDVHAGYMESVRPSVSRRKKIMQKAMKTKVKEQTIPTYVVQEEQPIQHPPVLVETHHEAAKRQARELAEEMESDEEHKKHCPNCRTDEDIFACHLQKAAIKGFQMGKSEAEVIATLRSMWRRFAR
jgi:hypothetical protein